MEKYISKIWMDVHSISLVKSAYFLQQKEQCTAAHSSRFKQHVGRIVLFVPCAKSYAFCVGKQACTQEGSSILEENVVLCILYFCTFCMKYIHLLQDMEYAYFLCILYFCTFCIEKYAYTALYGNMLDMYLFLCFLQRLHIEHVQLECRMDWKDKILTRV